jgi:dienelactone hydrolase
MSLMFAKYQRTALISLALAALIPGCANPPQRHPEVAAARQHLSPGYQPEQRHAVSSTRENWTLANDTVDVILTMPTGGGDFPLIVYLPGLGESAESGAAWRRPWAEAGYAVLSLQLDTVAQILSSPAARAGEFRELAREQFSPRALDHRQSILQKALAEISRRKSSGEASGFARIDLAHVAIAGFDLGAQTAMFAAGEGIAGTAPFPLPETVKCVVALSPYADFSGTGFEQRFKSVHVPVLSVTSMEDGDQFGLVTSAAVRRAPFEYMPPGQKYLLSLFAAPHALLSGKETPAELGGGRGGDERQAAPNTDDSGRGGKRGRGANRGGGNTGGETSGKATSPFSGQLSPGAWEEQLRYIQSVTTAYLDALLKNDPIAREWLVKDARRWLGDGANLVSK